MIKKKSWCSTCREGIAVTSEGYARAAFKQFQARHEHKKRKGQKTLAGKFMEDFFTYMLRKQSK